jgi:hypothetical protein
MEKPNIKNEDVTTYEIILNLIFNQLSKSLIYKYNNLLCVRESISTKYLSDLIKNIEFYHKHWRAAYITLLKGKY